MATLQDLLRRHLSNKDISARTLAEKLDMSYPTLLSLVNEGGVPRKQAHREALKRELGVDTSAWATALAASQKDAIDIPTEGPLSLQQLVLREMLAHGHTEQTLATRSGLPYPTIMGVTRKGAVPRGDTLVKLASVLDVAVDELHRAVERTRTLRENEDATDGSGTSAQPVAGPSLAQQALDAVTKSDVSMAAFAREHDLPYVSFARLISQGAVPESEEFLDGLRKALGFDDEAFVVALAAARVSRQPASKVEAARIAGTPLQAALRNLLESRGWTLQAFADAADLSVVTAGRLVRDGELPGRQATHAKLKTLLGLTEDAYELLVARSRQQTLAAEVAEHASGYHIPSVVPSIPSQPSSALEPATSAVRAAVQAVAQPPPKDVELMELIERLNPSQRRALDQFLRTLV